MIFLEKLTKLLEHKLIDNIIRIWKKLKHSKSNWSLATFIILFIFAQATPAKIGIAMETLA